MSDDAKDSRLDRLEFQKQSQAVQADITALVRELNRLIREARGHEEWPRTASATVKELVRAAYAGMDKWMALSPNPELLSLWEEIGSKLERLGPLAQEFGGLEAVAAERRPDMLNAFMTRYRQWLQEMNALEAQLLEREMDMAGLRAMGAQAARGRTPTSS